METQESRNLIVESKNIYLITSEEPEAIASTLALFYTLKNLSKNVNLLSESIPENVKFLAPSLDFISYPKSFVISIPNSIAQISQVYYEKNDEALKIFLTLESGNIKKENIAFYFSETKPDIVIALGIKDYAEQLKENLNSFGFLLDSPILNIDSSLLNKGERVDSLDQNGQENKKFGKINLLADNPLPEMVFNLIKDLDEGSIKKESATCLLAGLIFYTENFRKRMTAGVFETASELMKKGADLKEITDNIKV